MKASRLLRSSSFRLALVYMALFGISVLVLLGYIYWATAGAMQRQIDDTVETEVQGLAEQYRQLGLAGLILAVSKRVAADDSGDSIYLLTAEDRLILAGNLDSWPRAESRPGGWMDANVTSPLLKRPIPVRIRHYLLPGSFHLFVGRATSELHRLEGIIRDALIWGLGITTLLGIAGGVLVSREALGRIDSINRTSSEIMAGDLSRRVPTRGTSDEFDQLAQNLNEMLDQIERLLVGIKQVSDNIAHDLRSPINRLRSRLELALMEKPDLALYEETIEQAIAETEAIIGTFNALLTISRAEAGTGRESHEPVDLSRLARDAAEFYEPVAEEKDVSLTAEVEDCARVEGNRHLLAQAVANLLDNAVKYTPRGGSVTLSLACGSDGTRLVVADTGPGIPPEYRDKVLERFYRLEESRSTPGSGLGLSLVAAAARLHRARLTLGDNEPGLRVEIEFPPVVRGR